MQSPSLENLGCLFDFSSYITQCVFIPSPVREGSTLFGDHRGSILSNRAETSQEGQCGCQPEEISAQRSLCQERTNSKQGLIQIGTAHSRAYCIASIAAHLVFPAFGHSNIIIGILKLRIKMFFQNWQDFLNSDLEYF